MGHREIVAKIFRDYYDSSLMPAAYGGFEPSNFMQLFAAIMLLFKEKYDEIQVARNWYNGTTVTWYTDQLHFLLNIPRFPDDTDQKFLDRIASFQEAQEFGGQSRQSIRTVVAQLLSEAVGIDNITIITKVDTAYLWNDSETWDESITWAGHETLLDVDFSVSIRFNRSGFDTDEYAYEYWIKPENFTKIQDLVKLFKPVGKLFKIDLVAPPSRRRYWVADTRIKKVDNEFTTLSDTAIRIIDNEFTTLSDTSIKKVDNELTPLSDTDVKKIDNELTILSNTDIA